MSGYQIFKILSELSQYLTEAAKVLLYCSIAEQAYSEIQSLLLSANYHS